MSFELIDVFVMFQSYINKTLHFYLDIFVLVYIGHILVYSQTLIEHVNHVKSVLKRLRQFELFVKLKKYEFSISAIVVMSHHRF